MEKYINHKIRISLDVWEEIVKIANEEWDEEDKKIAQRIAPPGIAPNAPKNELIDDLLREALINRMCLSI